MMLTLFYVWLTIGIISFLLAQQASIRVWLIVYAMGIGFLLLYGSAGIIVTGLACVGLILVGVGAIQPLRARLFSDPLMRILRRSMPTMSMTEREALEAGTVSWEGDLFCGTPNFDRLHALPRTALTKEEQAFLDGPVHVLCRMVSDWDVTHCRTDLSPEAWSYIKEQGFLGMVIPKAYGGLGFSATAQMSIIVKLYSHSVSLATTVSVPNSLGPGELLVNYGTEEQKQYYLPRLARGLEIPCFALTGPTAGSDAASIPDMGVVCRQTVDGKEVIGIRLTWNKRYITLCPVATIIGLAFRLFDPENLLGKGEDVGISCALIPADTPGVIRGRRHFPLNTGFLNGPTQGKDVFISVDSLIGGPAMAGHGWRMLMECLSAGRAISLPSSASGGVQAAALGSGAYARIRKQFSQSISAFEGIKEPLARIATHTYLVDAALTMAASAIDQGEKPALAGAILKYHTTERARAVGIEAMDIHGGKGICLGPNNYLGRYYQQVPISITVEGANILSRSLIIFGQGVIRCHPYIRQEMEYMVAGNVFGFDKTLWNHVAFALANLVRSCVFAWTDAMGACFPKKVYKPARRYYQWIMRYSSHLACLADFSMLLYGGKLKRKETLSARLGDLLSDLYLASAVLKRFHDEGEPITDWPLVEWNCQQLLYQCDVSIQRIIDNFSATWARALLRIILQPRRGQRRQPSDKLSNAVASLLVTPSETRSRLGRLVFLESIPNSPLGRLEAAFQQICAVEGLEKKLASIIKEQKIKALTWYVSIEEAEKGGHITSEEARELKAAEAARQAAIAVDDFATEDLARH